MNNFIIVLVHQLPLRPPPLPPVLQKRGKGEQGHGCLSALLPCPGGAWWRSSPGSHQRVGAAEALAGFLLSHVLQIWLHESLLPRKMSQLGSPAFPGACERGVCESRGCSPAEGSGALGHARGEEGGTACPPELGTRSRAWLGCSCWSSRRRRTCSWEPSQGSAHAIRKLFDIGGAGKKKRKNLPHPFWGAPHPRAQLSHAPRGCLYAVCVIPLLQLSQFQSCCRKSRRC